MTPQRRGLSERKNSEIFLIFVIDILSNFFSNRHHFVIFQQKLLIELQAIEESRITLRFEKTFDSVIQALAPGLDINYTIVRADCCGRDRFGHSKQFVVGRISFLICRLRADRRGNNSSISEARVIRIGGRNCIGSFDDCLGDWPSVGGKSGSPKLEFRVRWSAHLPFVSTSLLHLTTSYS